LEKDICRSHSPSEYGPLPTFSLSEPLISGIPERAAFFIGHIHGVQKVRNRKVNLKRMGDEAFYFKVCQGQGDRLDFARALKKRATILSFSITAPSARKSHNSLRDFEVFSES
jgi:hypothetical protein